MASTSKKTLGGTSAPKRARAAVSKNVTHEAIALRAYEHFLARGRLHGKDVEDWLAAEWELIAR
jgi:hypothetical protein